MSLINYHKLYKQLSLNEKEEIAVYSYENGYLAACAKFNVSQGAVRRARKMFPDIYVKNNKRTICKHSAAFRKKIANWSYKNTILATCIKFNVTMRTVIGARKNFPPPENYDAQTKKKRKRIPDNIRYEIYQYSLSTSVVSAASLYGITTRTVIAIRRELNGR